MEDRVTTWSVRDAFRTFGVMVLASAIASGVLLGVTGHSADGSSEDVFVLGVLGTVLGMLAALVHARSFLPVGALAWRPLSSRWALKSIAMVGPVLAVGYLMGRLLEFFEVEVEPQDLVSTIAQSSNPATIALGLLYGIVGAAVFEELLFRGVIQPALVARWGRWPGLLGQALLFGTMHMADPWVVLPTTLIGVVAGWLREATGALGAPIVFHAANNTLAILLSWSML